jgi:cytochrome b subunit of formate dehydrogenase
MEAVPNEDCLECHADKELSKTNAAGQVISLYVDESRRTASVHRTNTCVSCHRELTSAHPDDDLPAKPVDCAACHHRRSATYGASVHGVAVKAGKREAATCRACHGNHDILPSTDPASPLHFARLAVTCGQCHPETARAVQESLHGQLAAKGGREAPTCTDCHSEHGIQRLKAASSLRLAAQICGQCHASERINTKFRLPANRVRTYFESYHGLAAQAGSTRAANCASCHGAHRILPSADPRSSIHRGHLVETCGKCHPGATEKFAFGKVHVDASVDGDTGAVVNRWVRRVYVSLIAVVVGLLGLHNLLGWGKQALAAYRSEQRSVLQLGRCLRLQHLVLLTSFFILAATGFALKYPNSWLGWLLGSDEALRRWLHRITGVALLGVGGFHLGYVLATAEGRRLFKELLPTRKDLSDLAAYARYLAGRTAMKPQFARYGYREKIEYWSVVWGTCIMGVTGLMMWLKLGVTHFLPRWVVEVALTVHFYEAILACLAVVVWHFYHVVFDPEVYPLNWAWWDGKAPAKGRQAEHPLDALDQAADGRRDVGTGNCKL